MQEIYTNWNARDNKINLLKHLWCFQNEPLQMESTVL